MIFEVQIENAHYKNVVAVERISFKVGVGQIVGILGANGAGKTTALLCIMGSVASGSRKLVLDGIDISGLPTWLLARHGIGFCPDGAWCFRSLTVQENLKNVYILNKEVSKNMDIDVKNPFEKVFGLFPVLRERRSQLAGTLSGGERKMLSIGRVLMLNPKVLVLDEPSSGLAPKTVGELYRAIATIKKAATAAIILAEQNAEICLKISDLCLALEQGRVVLEGPSSRLSENSDVRKAYLGI